MLIFNRLVLLIVFCGLFSQTAFAGTGTITGKDAGGATQTFAIITNSSGNYVWQHGICDGAAAAQCAAVKAASTAAGATDPAMVVAISPNNTVAVTESGTWNVGLNAGSNAIGSITNTSFAATQATAASLNATVVGTGTFAVQASESGTWNITNVSGTVSLPTGAATSANQTNASQKTQIVDGSGNVIASTSNSLNVQCANCSGSGASAADAATFTAGTSVMAPAGGEFTSGGATACVTGHQCMVGMTAARALFTDVSSLAGTALGAPSNYGTSPGAVEVLGVNAYVTNANANGQATMANSSPVVIASNQSAVPVSVSSGGIASGAIASGAVASGAFASGAFAAGSFVNATAGDPCMFQLKTNVPISTASGTTALVTGVSAKKIYVCSISLVAPSAVSVSLSEGSSATCGTSNQAAVIGVATNGTAANGMALAANGGITLGNGGGTVAQTATNANYLCLFQSGTAQLAGNITYIQQ